MVKKTDDMLSRFHLVPERNGRTDGQTNGQTDRFAISISRVSMLTRDKNTTDLLRADWLYAVQLGQSHFRSSATVELRRRGCL